MRSLLVLVALSSVAYVAMAIEGIDLSALKGMDVEALKKLFNKHLQQDIKQAVI